MNQVNPSLYFANRYSTKKKNVNQGGTSSAKTYTLEQVLFDLAIEDAGCVITVAGQDIPNLKKGAIRDSQKIVAASPMIQASLKNYGRTGGYNKTDRIYEFNNGSIMEFNSYDGEQDAKSGKRDYLFVNEANGISSEVYFQLSIRTKKKEFLDYNPTAKFWVHEKLIGNDDVALFISDHRHNRFLTAEQHAEIESIPDKELWKVYARGMTGQIKGLIYPNFQIIDAMPTDIEKVYGLDFGYTHMTALIETAKEANRIFWNEMIYQSELTIGDLIPLMKDLGLHLPRPKTGKPKIFCDHAAPDKIVDLKRAGFNVHPAEKAVENGIDYVKRHMLHITKWSSGLLKEIRSYKWKVITGPDGTQMEMREPVKFKDDGLDGGRYGSYSNRKGGKIHIANEHEYGSIVTPDTQSGNSMNDMLDQLH